MHTQTSSSQLDTTIAPIIKRVSPLQQIRVRLTRRAGSEWFADSMMVALLTIWAVLILIPLYILLSVAFKSRSELITNILGWPHTWQWSNFTQAWQTANLSTAFVNSVGVLLVTLTGLVLFGSMAAYPLARQTDNRWYASIYIYFVAGLIVPFQLVLIPLYGEAHFLGLVNSLPGLACIYLAGSLPFVIFLYASFIKSVPRELEEAAFIDGAGPFRTFWTIIFPLLGPVTATVIITSGLSIWNEFFVALIFLQDADKQTLPLAVFSFVGAYSNNWSFIFATIILSALPMIVLFFALQRYYIRGIAGSALKG